MNARRAQLRQQNCGCDAVRVLGLEVREILGGSIDGLACTGAAAVGTELTTLGSVAIDDDMQSLTRAD